MINKARLPYPHHMSAPSRIEGPHEVDIEGTSGICRFCNCQLCPNEDWQCEGMPQTKTSVYRSHALCRSR